MGGARIEVEVLRHFRAGERELRPGDRVPLSAAEGWRNWEMLREARMVRLVEARPEDGPDGPAEPAATPAQARRSKEAAA